MVSGGIAEEYLRVLDYPRIRKYRRITDSFVADVATYILFGTERIEISSRIKLSPDPDDDVFLATAIDGRADLIVSGNKSDLLSVRAVQNIPNLSAADAARRLRL